MKWKITQRVKSNIRYLSYIAILTSMAVMLTACGNINENKIKRTINAFERSCNRMDMKGMLDCMNPDLTGILQPLINSADIRENKEFLVKILDILYVVDSDIVENAVEFFEGFQIKVVGIEFEKRIKNNPTRAKAHAELHYTLEEREYETRVTFIMIEQDKRWYISAVKKE